MGLQRAPAIMRNLSPTGWGSLLWPGMMVKFTQQAGWPASNLGPNNGNNSLSVGTSGSGLELVPSCCL